MMSPAFLILDSLPELPSLPPWGGGPLLALSILWVGVAAAQEVAMAAQADPLVLALLQAADSLGLPGVVLAAIVILRGWKPHFELTVHHRLESRDRGLLRELIRAELDAPREQTEERPR